MPTASKRPNLSRAIFAAQVRHYRGLQDMPLKTLSEKTGLSYTYLSTVENGHSNISIDNIHDIAQALKVPTAALFIPDKWTVDKLSK